MLRNPVVFMTKVKQVPHPSNHLTNNTFTYLIFRKKSQPAYTSFLCLRELNQPEDGDEARKLTRRPVLLPAGGASPELNIPAAVHHALINAGQYGDHRVESYARNVALVRSEGVKTYEAKMASESKTSRAKASRRVFVQTNVSGVCVEMGKSTDHFRREQLPVSVVARLVAMFGRATSHQVPPFFLCTPRVIHAIHAEQGTGHRSVCWYSLCSPRRYALSPCDHPLTLCIGLCSIRHGL